MTASSMGLLYATSTVSDIGTARYTANLKTSSAAFSRGGIVPFGARRCARQSHDSPHSSRPGDGCDKKANFGQNFTFEVAFVKHPFWRYDLVVMIPDSEMQIMSRKRLTWSLTFGCHLAAWVRFPVVPLPASTIACNDVDELFFLYRSLSPSAEGAYAPV